MYHTCLRIVVNAADAEDILQEAFLEAFTTLNRLKNTDAFGGWIKRIVINKSVNYIKRKKENWVDIETAGTNILQEDDATDELEFTLKIEAIKAAIDALPGKHRTVINLHIFEKMGFEEIAVLMEIPGATVRSQYMRGRQKILTMIAK